MKQATLFICEGCTFNSEESKPNDITSGQSLLNQLQNYGEIGLAKKS